MNSFFNAEEVTRALNTGDPTRHNMYAGCWFDKKPFDSWERGVICYEIFDNYRSNQLCMQFDPFCLLFFDERDLKDLVLKKVDADVSNSDDVTRVSNDQYVINYRLLTSLDPRVVELLLTC